MSADPNDRSFDKKRRMSLKGPPLRVALKQTASTQPSAPVSVPQGRPSIAPAPVIDRRQSLSAKQAAKIVAQKPTTQIQAAKPVAQATIDPMITINSRLDTMERQISDLQNYIKQIVALEELVKPMKTAIDTLQLEVSDLGSSVKTLQIKKEYESKAIVSKALAMEDSQEASDDVNDVLDELDQSLGSGEIDLETYGSSLRYAFGSEGRFVNSAQMTPLMTSTPISKRSVPQTAKATANVTPRVEKPIQQAHSSQKSFVHEKTPIKKHVSSSLLSMPLSGVVVRSTPSTTPSETSSVPRVTRQLENTAISDNSNSTRASDLSLSKPSELPAPVLIESILEEEKQHVNLWLGLNIDELNRAIPVINQIVSQKRQLPEMATVKEVGFTTDDLATQYGVDAKRAKAIVLLLCNLKRLKLVRGDTTAYTLLAGTTLKQK